MRHLHLLIKPASGRCNMNCDYCFYHDVVEHREGRNYGTMTFKTLEKTIQRVYDEPYEEVTIMFQGGEPMLAGLDFYREVVQLIGLYNINQTKTNLGIQTNGTLITDEFAQFFKENNFLVGISIDGPKKNHDTFRKYWNQLPTHSKVMSGLDLLKKHKVDYNVLTVVTSKSVNHTEEIYNYLSSLGTMFLQFIPCIDSFDNIDPRFHLDNELYAQFLVRLFDVWEKDYYSGKKVSVRYFDDLLKMLLGYHPATCMLMGTCIVQNVVEADGSVYPCDFYVLEDKLIGNVFDDSFKSISQKRTAKNFILNSRGFHEDCKACKYFKLCKGGCRRYKEPYENVSSSKTKFCDAFTSFFDQRLDRLILIAKDIIKSQTKTEK